MRVEPVVRQDRLRRLRPRTGYSFIPGSNASRTAVHRLYQKRINYSTGKTLSKLNSVVRLTGSMICVVGYCIVSVRWSSQVRAGNIEFKNADRIFRFKYRNNSE